MIVVADASPLRYLILIEHVHVLPACTDRWSHHLLSSRNSTKNRLRISFENGCRPSRIGCTCRDRVSPSALFERFSVAAKREAIAIAAELSADVLLMDDRAARIEARRLNLAVLGTLRVLADAAEHDFADLRVAFDHLRRTNFRASEELMHGLLARGAKRR